MQAKRVRVARAASPITLLLAGGLLAAGLAGCAPKVDQRGNLPDPDDVLAIQPGIDDKIWDYISKKTEQMAFLDPEVLDQEVLEIKFDDGGIVKDMRLYGIEDGKEVDPVSRVTPTGGQELTFMKQLLGNIGRFNNNDSGGN